MIAVNIAIATLSTHRKPALKLARADHDCAVARARHARDHLTALCGKLSPGAGSTSHPFVASDSTIDRLVRLTVILDDENMAPPASHTVASPDNPRAFSQSDCHKIGNSKVTFSSETVVLVI
jgi:hypothetical protein